EAGKQEEGVSFLSRGETELKIDRSGLQRYLPQCLQFAFAEKSAESLYREYYRIEKRRNTKILLLVLALVDIVLLATYAAAFPIREAGQLAGQVTFLLGALLIIGVVFIVVRCYAAVLPSSRKGVDIKLWMNKCKMFCSGPSVSKSISHVPFSVIKLSAESSHAHTESPGFPTISKVEHH
ncbi:adenylate cyclase type 3, partial [Trichonephila clavata]